METRAHHVLIGAFTIGVFLLALGFVLWISKAGADHSYNDFDVVFTEAVTGLSVGGLVQYNGIKVGEVRQLHLDAKDPRKVIARIRIDASAPVRKDTRAKLGMQGITGLSFIQLTGGAPGSETLVPTREHPIPQIPAVESALSKLLASGSDVVVSANDVLVRMNQVLSEENVNRVSATLQHLDELTATLANQRGDLSTAIKQLTAATSTIRETLVNIDAMTKGANTLIREQATDVLKSAQAALDSVDRMTNAVGLLVDDNRAAINNFSNQGLRQIGPTVLELRETLRSLKQLTDKLGASDSLLLGREQPKEFKPQ